MDYIHSLLIMEDGLLGDDTDRTLCIAPAFPTAEPPPLGGSDPEPGPSPGTNLPWCKCGICQVMPQEIENKCDPPWENREKGERTGTRAMTRHANRVTCFSDMHICNKQNNECHGRYCFAR